jgi:hypothetical protein
MYQMYISTDAPESLRRLVARRKAAESAKGSLAAEGLRPTAASDQDADTYVRGALSAEEMAARALARHHPEVRVAAGQSNADRTAAEREADAEATRERIKARTGLTVTHDMEGVARDLVASMKAEAADA